MMMTTTTWLGKPRTKGGGGRRRLGCGFGPPTNNKTDSNNSNSNSDGLASPRGAHSAPTYRAIGPARYVSRLALLTTLTLVLVLALAIMIQTTDSREWSPNRRTLSASRRPNAHLRPVRSSSEAASETGGGDAGSSDEASSESRSDSPATSAAAAAAAADDAPDDNDETSSSSAAAATGSRSSDEAEAKPSENPTTTTTTTAPTPMADKNGSRFDMEAFEEMMLKAKAGYSANPNSGVEKGTETELPKVETVTDVAEAAKSQDDDSGGGSGGGGDDDDENSTAKTGIVLHSDNPATQAEKALVVGDASRITTPKPAKPVHKNTTEEAVEEGVRRLDSSDSSDSDGEEESRAGSEALTTSKPSAVAAEPAGSNSTTTSAPTTAAPTTTTTNTTKPVVARTAHGSASLNQTLFKEAKGARQSASSYNTTEKVRKAIQKLASKGEALAKRPRNTTIVINGRKFDQVMSVDCVDGEFYRMLSEDLAVINPGLKRDLYGTYYDSGYAKAVSAIVDTPPARGKEQMEEKPSKQVGDILLEVRHFWQETRTTYEAHRVNLGPAFGGRRLRRRAVSGIPKPQAALANYRYLLERLEQLKLTLMNGEEALVVLNNRVKKLNQVPTEEELHGALCSCITSRGGRAALSAMNELFVDKDSAALMAKPVEGKRRGESIARDVAEFCAFWYGDTLRSEAVQREKQIKKLVIKVAKQQHMRQQRKKITKKKTTTTITETKTFMTDGGITKREVHTRVVTAIVQMTELWMPNLAKWIKTTLNVVGQNVTENAREEKGNSTAPANNDTSPGVNRTRRAATSRETTTATASSEPESFFSTPFDQPGNYADLERPNGFDTVELMGGAGGSLSDTFYSLRRRRRRRAASPSSTSTTARPTRAPAKVTTRNPKLIHQPAKNALAKVSTTRAPPSTTLSPRSGPKETDFESRVSNRSTECARHGFAELLSIGFEQNALMYETNVIKQDDRYIVALREAFIASFPAHWRDRRNHWSRSMSSAETTVSSASSEVKKSSNSSADTMASEGRSVDEEMDDALGDNAGPYERGARLGFTIGKFIGDKSANQWPDPAELNTFSYDSLFLAGVGHGYTEQDSRLLEQRIVTETAKRVAFSEANRQAFAKTLHSSYLNGAYIVPRWGVLHAQRAIAKQAAKEGAKVGFDSASSSIKEFMPRANKFFLNHEHQRALASPYRVATKVVTKQQTSHSDDKWSGVAEQVEKVKREGELQRNISDSAVECGQKSGSIMGALMGLLITPEAFETYTRTRGSLEAFENEFYQFKLGAMRGYELGETWAQLNYTLSMQQSLPAMKLRMGSTTSGLLPVQVTSGSGGSKGNKTASAAGQQLKLKAEAISSSSLFESKGGSGDYNSTNTNNIFEFMILNYGSHLVANHSRRSMLKVRSMSMDENLLHDMKVQSGDLYAEPAAQKLSSAADDDGDELFEGGHYIGELKGEFNSVDNTRKLPLKFNIIDLGPELELNDESEVPITGSKHNSPLETTPLTSSLAKVGKIFMKFSVARRKKRNGKRDEVAHFLNSGPNGFDEGDGYLCGTYSQLTSRLPNGTSVQTGQALNEDDYSTEVSILDELFERIEGASLKMGSTVSLVENVMKVTTTAPKRIQTIAVATTSLRPSNGTLSGSDTTKGTTTTTTTTTLAPTTLAPPASNSTPGDAARSRSATLLDPNWSNEDDDADSEDDSEADD